MPAVIPPDPARDARRAAYKARERIRISRAFDSFMCDLYGEVFEERYGTKPDRYTESEIHHNRNYGVTIEDGDPTT